jgi:hypothetical protein
MRNCCGDYAGCIPDACICGMHGGFGGSRGAGALGFTFSSIPLWEELSVKDGHERAADSRFDAESGRS